MITATNIRDDFRQAIEQAGLTPPDEIIADGTLHRFASNGDHADDAGWYVFHDDSAPAGIFGCWRSGIVQRWHAERSTPMTAAERLAHAQRVAELRRIRKEEKKVRHAEAARRAQALWDQAAPATPEHPYLQRKRIQAHGLRLGRDNRLIVP